MPDLVICEWRLHPTDAGECVCSAVAMVLPGVCTRLQNERPVAEDNRVTDDWENMHRGSLLKSGSLQADVLNCLKS